MAHAGPGANLFQLVRSGQWDALSRELDIHPERMSVVDEWQFSLLIHATIGRRLDVSVPIALSVS
jgi:hypothetical protein